jgi:hypothetical protein
MGKSDRSGRPFGLRVALGMTVPEDGAAGRAARSVPVSTGFLSRHRPPRDVAPGLRAADARARGHGFGGELRSCSKTSVLLGFLRIGPPPEALVRGRILGKAGGNIRLVIAFSH